MTEEKSPKDNQTEKEGIKIIHSWKAPERVWQPKTKLWYMSSTTIVMILILLAAIWGYWIMILALMAFLVLWLIQGTMEPWILEHKLTTKGMFTQGSFFDWEDIDYFWFGIKGGRKLLYLDFEPERNKPRLMIVLENEDDADVELFDMMIKHLKYASSQAIGYNVLSQIVYGKYVPITQYIEDEDQPRQKAEKRLSIGDQEISEPQPPK